MLCYLIRCDDGANENELGIPLVVYFHFLVECHRFDCLVLEGCEMLITTKV